MENNLLDSELWENTDLKDTQAEYLKEFNLCQFNQTVAYKFSIWLEIHGKNIIY